jgi:D-glycerate 3-kinase
MPEAALPAGYADTLERLLAPLAEQVAGAAEHHGPGLVVGLCGAQGSGKTTAAGALRDLLKRAGLSAVVLSLDDLYLPLADREQLAAEVHPLLGTRGVPGTHDAALGLALIESLSGPGETQLPRFDKAVDDRAPPEQWPRAVGPIDVIIFEGWCVGARPQAGTALEPPLNALEREQDPQGVWRWFVNIALATAYRPLFERIDLLALLAAPSFDVVLDWRREQEHALRAARGADAGMSDSALATFVQHYERLTRHILAEMPGRADLVAQLGPKREVLSVTLRSPPRR